MKTDPSLLRQNTVSWLTLFAASGTLICCALPILFVTLGLGAAVAAVTSAVSPALTSQAAAVRRVYPADSGQTNPLLHLSMHLSISEQCSIDQPRGIRQAVELLTHKLNSLHDAHHPAMECLGRMVYESQRSGRMPDGQAYIDCVQRHATRD